jgi:hypothetical protein
VSAIQESIERFPVPVQPQVNARSQGLRDGFELARRHGVAESALDPRND